MNSKSRKLRRKEWRGMIKSLSQSKTALESGLDRAERRRRARELWGASSPSKRVFRGYNHWMSKRIKAVQIGLMALNFGELVYAEED